MSAKRKWSVRWRVRRGSGVAAWGAVHLVRSQSLRALRAPELRLVWATARTLVRHGGHSVTMRRPPSSAGADRDEGRAGDAALPRHAALAARRSSRVALPF